uniref:Uncharacterized protein n=1 Tax=Caenorhabditis japonica TaxID=281687 RepID=A0A8R1EQW9_CAEJA
MGYKYTGDGNKVAIVVVMAQVSKILTFLLILLIAMSEAIFSGESRKKGSNTIVRQKRQYLGYPYGMGYPYSYGYNPYMMYRPYPAYGMPYYRPYGYWGK